jgi:hypothetical protein
VSFENFPRGSFERIALKEREVMKSVGERSREGEEDLFELSEDE